MEDDRFYIVESPTRIKLKPAAREMAREYGMSERDFARYLLRQHQLREAGMVQRDGEN